MAEKKKTARKALAVSLGMRLWLCALGSSLVALVVYGLTLAGYVFPGESAHLFTQWMGMDALAAPVHPIWGAVVKFVGGMSSLSSVAVRLNTLSLLCGALSAGFVCVLVGFFILVTA